MHPFTLRGLPIRRRGNAILVRELLLLQYIEEVFRATQVVHHIPPFPRYCCNLYSTSPLPVRCFFSPGQFHETPPVKRLFLRGSSKACTFSTSNWMLPSSFPESSIFMNDTIKCLTYTWYIVSILSWKNTLSESSTCSLNHYLELCTRASVPV